MGIRAAKRDRDQVRSATALVVRNAEVETDGKARIVSGGTSCLACLALRAALGSGARADDGKATGTFGWFGVGKVQQLEKGHIFWVGEFSGSFANDKGKGSPLDQTGWRCPGSNDLDFNNKKGKAAGYCIISDMTGGDQAYLSWQCEGDTQSCNGVFDYTGGTGKYQEVPGHQRP